ncbi:MAG: molybdopterin molybdotransferase MoeA [Dictyoglomaceae bacterium]
MEKFLILKSPMEVYKDIIEAIPYKGEKEKVTLEKALGKILAENIYAPENYPDFSLSTVDGYAVKIRDILGADLSNPSYLKKKGIINIGEEIKEELKEGETFEIVTGAMIPRGTEGIVMREYVRDLGEYVEVFKSISEGENIFFEGEDIKKGELILEKGERISIRNIGVLASLGIYEVNVYSPIKVHIYSSGDEIIPPYEKKIKGKVRDINTFNIISLLSKENVTLEYKGNLKDDFNIFKSAFEKSLESADIIVVSGGSSKSSRDYTEEAINTLGKPGVILHGILISPGKPTILGRIDNKYIFGLPGHPSSCLVVSFLFLLPLIRRLSGKKDIYPKSIYLVLRENVYAKQGRETYIFGKRDGEFVIPLPTESPLISSWLKSEGIIKIPLGEEGKEKGEKVEFFPWEM